MTRSTVARVLARGIRPLAIFVLLAALGGVGAAPPAAHALALIVDTTVDNPSLIACTSAPGDCSLRGAISRANTSFGADTITFDAATDATPIFLTGAVNENGNGTGDLDILCVGDLTIQGNGAAKTIIDGNDIDRVLHVCPGGGCASTVTLVGVTIRNGDTGGGGGIYNQATLNVQDSTIGGAGVGNAAYNGAGIYSSAGSTTTLEGCTISGNEAGIDGGGIYSQAGSVTTVDGSTVSANTAERGGGIYSEGTLYVLKGSVIGGSSAANTADNGGGIYAFLGTTIVDGSTVSANTASQTGGGIWNSGTLEIKNGSVVGSTGASNQASFSGGGIYNYGTTTVDGSTVSANTAETDGGGIYNQDTLNIQNGSIIGGIGAGNAADGKGGGVCNRNGTTTLDGSTVSANTADRGGGIYNETMPDVESGISASASLNVLNGSTIGGTGAGNTAATWGGGIYNAYASTTKVVGSRILHNGAANGGGVFNGAQPAGSTSVTASCIVGNSDTALYSELGTQQTATGNWWGAATGPNTTGADTASGAFAIDPFLTTPILGCAPDLQVTKANDTGGAGRPGTPFHWTLTVANTGVTDALFYAGQRILDDDLPPGPTYGAPAVGNLVDVTNGANIGCSITVNNLTCEATGANVTIGTATGRFDIVLPVTPAGSGTLSNPAGDCRVDPQGKVGESDEDNNDCSADSVDVTVWCVYLPLVRR